RAQRADEGEQSGLAGAGGASEDDDLPRHYLQGDVVQHPGAQGAAAELVGEVAQADEGLHQNISAGWVERSLPIASSPDSVAMARMQRNTTPIFCAVIGIGMKMIVSDTA